MIISGADFLKWCAVFGVETGNVGPTSGASKREVQVSAFNFGDTTGADDAFIVTLTPAVTVLTDGLLVTMSSIYSNLTTSPTLKIDGLTPVPIVLAQGADLAPGDIQPNNDYIFIYNLAENTFQLINPTYSVADTFSVQENTYKYAIDAGVANAYVITLLPTPLTVTQGGMSVLMKVSHNNTGASTIAINGHPALPIVNIDGTALTGGELILNRIESFIFNDTLNAWVLQNSTIPTGAVLLNPSANQTILNAHDLILAQGNFVSTVNGFVSGNSALGGIGGFFKAYSNTALKGSLTFQCLDNVGDFANILENASTTNARTWTLPDASGTLALTSNIPTGSALTKTDDTNVTLTLGGSPSTALVNAASLALGWTGQLSLTRGGSNASLTASNGGIIYSTASAMAILAGTATAGQMLQSGANDTPAWSTTTYPSINAINTIMYASSANVLGSIAAANSSVLVTSAGGVPSFSTTLPSVTIPSILDTNGATLVQFLTAASAVNYLAITNSATGGGPTLSSPGSDSNINITLLTKGTGQLVFDSANTTTPIIINSGTTLQHRTDLTFSNTAASRVVTFPDATGTLLMTGVAINTVPSIAFSSTSGVIGTTTNDSAAAGSVGEFVTSNVLTNTTSLTTGTIANTTSISLTAGDWDVFGAVGFFGGSTTVLALFKGWISTTSAADPGAPNYSSVLASGTPFATSPVDFVVPSLRVSISGTTTVYLSVQATFTVSTCTSGGVISARRMR